MIKIGDAVINLKKIILNLQRNLKIIPYSFHKHFKQVQFDRTLVSNSTNIVAFVI